jgi:hypothetical protein
VPLDGAGMGWPDRRSNSSLDGEIRSVDTRRHRLEVRSDWGRSETVRYNGRTQVRYGNRTYPVSALERGDQVRIRLAYDRDGSAFAERIDVRSSVRDRSRSTARTERIDGTVGRVDSRRGHFTLERGRNQTVLVYVPNRLSRDDARRVDRLRRGDRVRLEVRPVGRSQAELVRFR